RLWSLVFGLVVRPNAIAAIESLGDFEREKFLADAFLAGKKQRASRPPSCEQTPQRVLYFVVADEMRKHKSKAQRAKRKEPSAKEQRALSKENQFLAVSPLALSCSLF